MGIMDIDNMVNRVVKGGVKPSFGQSSNTLTIGLVATAEDVAKLVEVVLDKIPNVEKASGQITVKLTNSSTPKTIGIKYR
jgi:hypothetical protein